jgi:hypothetical protein
VVLRVEPGVKVARAELRINEQFYTAGDPQLLSDEPRVFERQHHLVNRRGADAEIFLHIGFGRRPPVQAHIGVDKRQILALRVGESLRRATQTGHPIQLSIQASSGEEEGCRLAGAPIRFCALSAHQRFGEPVAFNYNIYGALHAE